MLGEYGWCYVGVGLSGNAPYYIIVLSNTRQFHSLGGVLPLNGLMSIWIIVITYEVIIMLLLKLLYIILPLVYFYLIMQWQLPCFDREIIIPLHPFVAREGSLPRKSIPDSIKYRV